jgi:hypothetical protein
MADNIVGGLFGIDPQQLMQQRQATDAANAYRYAQLSPLQQANMSIYQGSAGLARGVGGLLGGDPELEKVSAIKQLSSQFDLASPIGMRDFARSLQAQFPQEAMMAARRADEMETTGLGRQKTQLDIQRTEGTIAKEALSATQEEKLRAELAALGPNPTDQQVIAVVQKYGSPDKILQVLSRKQEREDALAARRATAGGEGSESSLGKLTTAQKAVDTKFSKDYTEYFSGGGINNLEKNIAELGRAIKIIENSAEGETSGKLVGLADKTGQLTFASQKAADVKDIIGGVAQSNLRQVLGGQFAQKEGEALLQRQYDTGQSKANNLNRLRSLYSQASETVQAKKAAAQYYEEFGTLKNFKGTTASQETPKPSGEQASKSKKTRTLKSGVVVTIED